MSSTIGNITVLMPAYNCAAYLKQSIRSILNQTFKEFEFLIIDDGSTDNTEEIVNSFKDSRIVYNRTNENKGTAAALNFGLKMAAGNWIARIDADDLNTADRLETQINFIKDNPQYDIISSWSVYFRNRSKILFALKEPVVHSDIHRYLNLHNPLNQSGLFFKKEKVINHGFDEKYLYNEDFELLHRIRDEVKFYNIPQFLVYTRVRKDSKTFTQKNNNIYDFLFPTAFKSLMEPLSKGRSFYWASTIAWINFFYGERRDARSYFLNSFSPKNWIAYLTTFLPENIFYKMIDLRIKYRLKAIFTSNKLYKKKLKKLLQ